MVYWGGDNGTSNGGGQQTYGSGGGGSGLDTGKLVQLMKMLGIGMGAGTAAGGAYNLFNAGKNTPSAAAKPYLDQIPDVGHKYLDPYVNLGQEGMDTLKPQYADLLNDTGGKYDQITKGYKESPGYQFKLKQALNAANNAESAGGMLGTPEHKQVNMEAAEGIASKDFEDYVNHAMHLFDTGLKGEEGFLDRGQKSSSDLADMIASALSQQGQNAFVGQQDKNTQKSGGYKDIISGLMQILPMLFA